MVNLLGQTELIVNSLKPKLPFHNSLIRLLSLSELKNTILKFCVRFLKIWYLEGESQPTPRSPLDQYKLLTSVGYQITNYLMISSTDSKTNINLYLEIIITVTNHFYALNGFIISLLSSQRVNICITSKVFQRVFNHTKYLYLLLIQYWTILRIQVLRKYNWVNSNLMQQLSNYEHQIETEISSRQLNKVKTNQRQSFTFTFYEEGWEFSFPDTNFSAHLQKAAQKLRILT